MMKSHIIWQLCLLVCLVCRSATANGYGSDMAFYDSISEGNFWRVLLQLWSNVDVIDMEDLVRHQTPLHVAAEFGQTDIVELLLNHQANKSSADLYLQTPLHEAVGNGHLAVVQALLARPMNTAMRNILGYIPLHLASIWGQHKIVEALLDFEIMTVRSGRIDVFQLPKLRDPRSGAMAAAQSFSSLDIPDADQHTALHLAVIYDEVQVVQTLLDFDANVTAVDAVKWTPLHLAALKGHLSVLKVLLNHIVFQHKQPMEHYAYIYNVINAKNVYAATPLHTACMHGQLAAALLLISYGADGNSLDVDGLTPLSFVENSDDAEVLLQAMKVQQHSKLTFQLQEAMPTSDGDGDGDGGMEVDLHTRASNAAKHSPVYLHYHEQWQETLHAMRESSGGAGGVGLEQSGRLYAEYYRGGKSHPGETGAVGSASCEAVQSRYDTVVESIQKLKFDFLAYQHAAEKTLLQLSEKHESEIALLQSLLADSKLGAGRQPQELSTTTPAADADADADTDTDTDAAAVDPYLSKWIFDLQLSTNSGNGNSSTGDDSIRYEQYFRSLGFKRMEDVTGTLTPLSSGHPELIGAIFHKLNSADQQKVISAVSKLSNTGANANTNANARAAVPAADQPAKSGWSFW